jgi:WXG100 family type VII secretion target
MSDEIQCNYDDMEQISGQFSNQAQNIQAMQQKIRGSYAKLVDQGWIGAGANAFFDEMESLILPAQERLQDALEQAGQASQQIAESVKTAEQDASSLFRS